MNSFVVPVLAALLAGCVAAGLGWLYLQRKRQLQDLERAIARGFEGLLLGIRQIHTESVRIQRETAAHVAKVALEFDMMVTNMDDIRDVLREMRSDLSSLRDYVQSGEGVDEPFAHGSGQRDATHVVSSPELFRRLQEGSLPAGYHVESLELERRGDPLRSIPFSLVRASGGKGGLLWLAETGQDIGRLFGHRSHLDPDEVRVIWGGKERDGGDLPGLLLRRVPAGTLSSEDRPWGPDVDRWILVTTEHET